MANVLDWDILVSVFELLSRYCVHSFDAKMLGILQYNLAIYRLSQLHTLPEIDLLSLKQIKES